MTVLNSNGLPDIVSVQKRLYPLIFTAIVSEQPTEKPVATAYGFKAIKESSDGSGWAPYGFKLDRWNTPVESSKMKTEISLEAIEDMISLGVNTDIITDSLADQIADDINTRIIDALNKISSEGDAITLSNDTKFNKGRELYSYAHDAAAEIEKTTGCAGTYIVAGGKCFGLLTGSGLVARIEDSNIYECESGMTLVHDKYATSNYITVGVKKKMGDYEISSLVFSPYNFDKATDGGIAYQYLSQDPKSFHPVYGVISRFALTVAPMDSTQGSMNKIDWDDLGDLKGSSKLSYTHAVTI